MLSWQVQLVAAAVAGTVVPGSVAAVATVAASVAAETSVAAGAAGAAPGVVYFDADAADAAGEHQGCHHPPTRRMTGARQVVHHTPVRSETNDDLVNRMQVSLPDLPVLIALPAYDSTTGGMCLQP